jgi:phenylacetate-CoA ligase
MEPLMKDLSLGGAGTAVSGLNQVTQVLHGLRLSAWQHGAAARRAIEGAAEREGWPHQQLRAWQEERLAHMLWRAATQVPYYRAQWRRRRQRGDRASWEQLENWPVLSRDAVRAQPGAFVADDCPPRQRLAGSTSGTTGAPLELWWQRAALRQYYALSVVRSRHWHGLRAGDRRALLDGRHVVPAERRVAPFWAWDRTLNQLSLSTFHFTAARAPAYLQALIDHRITCLSGYTSQLLTLAQEALAQAVSLRMKVVIATGEPLTGDTRHTIARAFGCPVRDTYAAAEMAIAASECPAGRLHLWPEVGWTEVHCDDAPAPAGVMGDLICTGMMNPAMPLVRYAVGDVGRLAADTAMCSCGRTLPRMDRIMGRTDDFLLTPAGERVRWLNTIFHDLPVRHGQIVQHTPHRVSIRYVPGDGFSAAARTALRGRLELRMAKVVVALEEVAQLPRTRAGKVRTVICNIPAAQRSALLRKQPTNPAYVES